jgi:hypothetical protein
MRGKISVSKEVIPELPESFHRTLLGSGRGAVGQYRNSGGLHVREYRDSFEIHQDRVNPEADPLGHLLKDSPETLVAAGAALLLSSLNRSRRDRRLVSSPFAALLGFFLLQSFFRGMKRLLVG